MSVESDPKPGSAGPLPGPRKLYLLLVVLPLGVAGIVAGVVRGGHGRSLAVAEAGRMAEAGLALVGERGTDDALRILEGVVGYEAALYRNARRTAVTDPGFGPETLEPEPDVVEMDRRIGVVAEGPELALLAAASSPRHPSSTAMPGGPWTLLALALGVLMLGLAVLSRRRTPALPRLGLVAGVPVAIAWILLAGTASEISDDAEAASAREVGLAAALARELGPATPADRLARVSGLRVARLQGARVLQASWDDRELDSELQGLPRPPMNRTITGYLTTSEEKLRYAASRGRGGTTVFLAPAPDLPPRSPALRLLLTGLAVTAAAAAFVFLSRKS